jgi:acetyl esterase/lipase
LELRRNAGVEVEYRRYRTAGHGFGLGTDTDAEGWLGRAVRFWEKHLFGKAGLNRRDAEDAE